MTTTLDLPDQILKEAQAEAAIAEEFEQVDAAQWS